VAAGDFFLRSASSKGDSPALQQQLYDKARKAFQQAIKVDPNYTPAYESLANLYLILEDSQRAVETYQKAIQVAPNNAQLWYELGMCQCRRKDFAHGVTGLTKACDLDPENRQYANVLGFTLARMGRYDESLACFSRVLNKAKAHYNLARMLQHTQQTDLCKYHLQCALQEDPTLEPAQKLLVQITTGIPSEVQPTSYQEVASDSESETPAPISPYAHMAGSQAPASAAAATPMYQPVTPVWPSAPVPAQSGSQFATDAPNPMPGIATAPLPAPRPNSVAITPEAAPGGIQAVNYEFEQDSQTLPEETDLLPPPPALQAAPSLTTETVRKPLPRFEQTESK